MHRKSILFFCLGIILLRVTHVVQAQVIDLSGRDKYEYYRVRFESQFIVHDFSRGEQNQPQGKPDGFGIPGSIAFRGEAFDGSVVDLQWGDATIDLGWYIGVLATEFYLLRQNNQPVEYTAARLRSALLAYERLDLNSDILYYPHNARSFSDGLFVRDDVVNRIFDTTALAGFYKTAPTTPTSDGKFFIKSDFLSNNPNDKMPNIYPSPDQIAHLFLGFALVKKFLTEADNYYGFYFVDKVKGFTKDIVKRLRHVKVNSIIPRVEWYGTINQNTRPHHPVYPNGKVPVKLNSRGISLAAKYITDRKKTVSWSARTYWNFLYSSNIPWYYENTINNHDFSTSYWLALAAIGGDPRGRGRPIADSVEINQVKYKSTFLKFCVSFDHNIYLLLRDALWTETGTAQRSFFVNAIQSAPNGGVYHKPTYNALGVGSPGWMAHNRWIRPIIAAEGFEYKRTLRRDPVEQIGAYNGLDYMLLYNLLMIVHPDYFASDVNYRGLVESGLVP
ncbi:MAG: hypothetical protein OEX02_01355 [Cyclobacteriaceae bacterium]|nr:hypothetical protein [Cyclobacteriaceae bacterium]